MLDRGIGALLPDLASRGMLDETLVVLATEFGRTPEITDNNGRNHHPRCFFGAARRWRGQGRTGLRRQGQPSGDSPAQDPVSVQDFNATIGFASGLPLEEVVHSPAGRPFTVPTRAVR